MVVAPYVAKGSASLIHSHWIYARDIFGEVQKNLISFTTESDLHGGNELSHAHIIALIESVSVSKDPKQYSQRRAYASKGLFTLLEYEARRLGVGAPSHAQALGAIEFKAMFFFIFFISPF